MIQYDHSFEHDGLLLKWYQELLRTDELQSTFMPRAQSLSGFLATFQRPVELFFAVDDGGIYWAGWFEPGYGGMFYGMWIRPDHRGKWWSFHWTMTALDSALTFYPAVMGITKQPALLDPHRLLGYTIYEPPIPGLWGAEPAWLVVLTRDNFEKGKPYGRWRRKTIKFAGSGRPGRDLAEVAGDGGRADEGISQAGH